MGDKTLIMGKNIENSIIGSIKDCLKKLQKEIIDIEVERNSNNKEEYIIYDIHRFYTVEDLFKFLICDFDGALLYKIFGIEPFVSNDKVNFNDDFDSPKDNPHISSLVSVKLQGIKLLSKVIRYRLYIHNNAVGKQYLDDFVKVINDYAEHVDSFNSRYFIKVDFNYYNDTIDSELIFEDLYVESEAYGIKQNSSLPLWVEYLINSLALFRAGNNEMAFFVAFASLDCFIEKLNSICIEIYSNIKNTEMNLKDFSACYSKYENYKNDNRRLIKEKLKTILSELYSDDDDVIKGILCNLKNAESKRNNIAHCNDKSKYEEGDYENLLLNYLNLIYKLKYDETINAIFGI